MVGGGVGRRVIPLRVNFVIEAQAGTVNIALAAWDVINRFSAGGVAAVAARNLHGGNPRSSVVTNLLSGDTAITALASSAQRTLQMWTDPAAVATSLSVPWQFDWLPPYPGRIQGPGSFLFYVHSTGTAAEFQVLVEWAEIATADLIGA